METTEKFVVKGGRTYCLLCSNYRGKILDNGSQIILHKIPNGKSENQKKRRQLWLQRIKLVRPNAPISTSSSLCNLHFDNNVCTSTSIPTNLHLNKCAEETIKTRRVLVRHEMNIDKCDTNDVENNENCNNLTLDDGENIVPSKIKNIDMETQTLTALKITSTTETQTCINVLSCSTQTCSSKLKFSLIENDDQKTKYYTGFPNYSTFSLFYETFLRHGADKLTYWEGNKRTVKSASDRQYASPSISKPGKKRMLETKDEFLMTMVKLRHGLGLEMLADMFSVSTMTASRVFNTWINFMYDHMLALIPWPNREQILANLPRSFSDMGQVRIVIDATEFFCEKPGNLQAQYVTWSEYKHHNTYKVLIGVSPSGLVTFVSRVWGGHTSDRYIVQNDGDMFLPKMEYGDIILADKGFTVTDLLPSHIGLNMPPFVSTKKQMTKQEFFKTQQIAAPRIVVEMKMEQIKNFKILQHVLPISEVHLAEQIILICSAITNLYKPLLK